MWPGRFQVLPSPIQHLLVASEVDAEHFEPAVVEFFIDRFRGSDPTRIDAPAGVMRGRGSPEVQQHDFALPLLRIDWLAVHGGGFERDWFAETFVFPQESLCALFEGLAVGRFEQLSARREGPNWLTAVHPQCPSRPRPFFPFIPLKPMHCIIVISRLSPQPRCWLPHFAKYGRANPPSSWSGRSEGSYHHENKITFGNERHVERRRTSQLTGS
jgi:hypothetical protein